MTGEEIFGPQWQADSSWYARSNWLPPTPAFAREHFGQPEDPGLRTSFGLWARAAFKREAVPDEVIREARYLRVGEGYESRDKSRFWAQWRADGRPRVLFGFFYEIILIADLGEADLPAGARELAECTQTRAPGTSPPPIPEWFIAAFRTRAESLLQPRMMPASQEAWLRQIAEPAPCYNGVWVGWSVKDTKLHEDPLLPHSDHHSLDPTPSSVLLWTNGRFCVLTIMKPEAVYRGEVAQRFRKPPKPATTTPLNPQFASLFDEQNWLDDDFGPVSDPARASYANVRIELTGPVAGEWRHAVLMPLTDAKWHLCEARAACELVQREAEQAAYCNWLEHQILGALRVGKPTSDLIAMRGRYLELAAWFRGLTLPPSMARARQDLVDWLDEGVAMWEAAWPIWEPVLSEEPPDIDAAEAAANEVHRQLRDAGLPMSLPSYYPHLRAALDTVWWDEGVYPRPPAAGQPDTPQPE